MAFIPNDPPRRREAVAAIPNPRSQEITVSDILAELMAAEVRAMRAPPSAGKPAGSVLTLVWRF